uniref:Uncharacterized protein n=1 Tax=Eutreptiella gymnastica TaxID=73025 RepID=A0A7S4FUP0_9EUGL
MRPLHLRAAAPSDGRILGVSQSGVPGSVCGPGKQSPTPPLAAIFVPQVGGGGSPLGEVYSFLLGYAITFLRGVVRGIGESPPILGQASPLQYQETNGLMVGFHCVACESVSRALSVRVS